MAGESAADARKKPKRLGRGLSSLLNEPVAITPAPPAAQSAQHGSAQQDARAGDSAAAGADSPKLRSLAIESIVPNRHQPRQHFDDAALERLAQSIASAGVMQPIVVRPLAPGGDAPSGAAWELVAGERRWRAAQRAGLPAIPAVVSELSERDAAEWSLVENLQREDLNPIERAQAFRRLQESFGLTQAEVAQRVGLDRSTIANLIRLTELEEIIQDEIAAGRLTPGHGKALLSLTPGKGRVQLAIRARDGAWSVRRLEQHVQQLTEQRAVMAPTGSTSSSAAREAAKRDLERRLRERLGTKVHVRLDAAGLRGRIQVDFYDLDQLDGVLRKMGVSPERVG